VTTPHERDHLTSATAGATATPVIDLREAAPASTRVRVSRDDNPFSAMAPPERMRLIIRVLCELVAYDELDADTAADHRRTLRATVAESTGTSTPTSVTG
jgi:hypothetical protein